MSPLTLTVTELIAKSDSNGRHGSQLSPPLTETAIVFRPATATIFPEALMLAGETTPGSTSFRHVSPESELEKNPFAVAANHRSALLSTARIRVFNSAAIELRSACRLPDAPFLPASAVRAVHADAPGLS